MSLITKTRIRGLYAFSGAVVEEVTREGEVKGSNPAGRVAREYCVKNAATCRWGTFFLPWFVLAHGKGFAVCPRKGTRKSRVCCAVSTLPCATHGKVFAMCFRVVPVCQWHKTNRLNPVVYMLFFYFKVHVHNFLNGVIIIIFPYGLTSRYHLCFFLLLYFVEYF